jgi:hypothetical protein
MAEKHPSPADDSAAVAAMRPDWDQAAALLGGTRAMRAAGTRYLPKWPAEEQAAYEARLAVAVLFPAFARTVETLKGKPFSKPVTLDEAMPAEVQEWMQNVDREGRNITAFAGDLMTDCLGPGLCGILVDFPVVKQNTEGRPLTQAEEKAQGLRPYWIHIRPGALRGWKILRQGGTFKLMQLRFVETVEEDDGPFGTKDVQQVRVLEPGKWTTYRQDAKQQWVEHDSGVTTVDFIPFVPCYGKRTGFLTAEPPLRDLGFLNIAHWQSASDQQNILHVARVPILVRKGCDQKFDQNGLPLPNELKLGAGAAVDVPKEGDLAYVEHTGAAIGAGKTDIDDLEERMRQAGAELLVIKPGEVTATQTATENAVGMCALQAITLGLQDSINLALDYTAKMVRQPTAGTVTLFNDFGALTLESASAQLILSANTSGLLSKQTTIDELKRRGVLSENVNAEDEQERIQSEPPPLGTLTEPPTGKPAPVEA